MLALAPAERRLDGNLVFHRLDAGAFMAAVAKWRMAGAAAGAPPVDAGFDFQDQRLGVTDNRFFGHGRKPAKPLRRWRAANRGGLSFESVRRDLILVTENGDRPLLWKRLFDLSRKRHRATAELRITVHRNLAHKSGTQPKRKQRGGSGNEESDFHQKAEEGRKVYDKLSR